MITVCRTRLSRIPLVRCLLLRCSVLVNFPAGGVNDVMRRPIIILSCLTSARLPRAIHAYKGAIRWPELYNVASYTITALETLGVPLDVL